MELAKEKEVWPSKLATLIDIQMEMLAPGGELRPPSQPLSEEEVFMLQVCVRMCVSMCVHGVH